MNEIQDEGCETLAKALSVLCAALIEFIIFVSGKQLCYVT